MPTMAHRKIDLVRNWPQIDTVWVNFVQKIAIDPKVFIGLYNSSRFSFGAVAFASNATLSVAEPALDEETYSRHGSADRLLARVGCQFYLDRKRSAVSTAPIVGIRDSASLKTKQPSTSTSPWLQTYLDTGSHFALTLSLHGTGRIVESSFNLVNGVDVFTAQSHHAVAAYSNSPFGDFTDAVTGTCGTGAFETVVWKIYEFRHLKLPRFRIGFLAVQP